MSLEPLPDYRETVVVVGTSVRKAKPILDAYLKSLDWQQLPPQTRLLPVFVPDFAPDQQDAQESLFRWVNERQGVLLEGLPQSGPDFSDAPGLQSHQWERSAMERVGKNKNLILEYALAVKADYVFLADADLILDRTTIASLLAADKPIATAVYWTRWARTAPETRTILAAPQVWLRHPYELSGRGMDEAEFRTKLLSRDLVRVWGFGACTLIQRRVLEAGISFAYLPDVPMDGLMAGEDRHFSVRTERAHIEAWADTWPDIFHIYHADKDVPLIPAMLERLGAAHPDRAKIGDLVSLCLRALEPVPIAPGRVQHLHPLVTRGRLGKLDLLPEIEAAVLELKRGEKKIVRAHFPMHYPLVFLRGRIRLIEVTLLDAKPYGASPVVEDDLYLHGARYVDPVTLTADQRESIQEVANG